MTEARHSLENHQANDYRTMLRDVLSSRTQRNPGYSARAFARDLEPSSSFLSQVFKGKRNLSEEMGLRIAGKLGWAGSEQDLFLALIRLELTTDPDLRERLRETIEFLRPSAAEFRDLSADHFEAMSSWYHFAIIERARIGSKSMEPDQVALDLAITREDASSAIDRLLRLGMLNATDHGIVPNDDHYRMPAVPSRAIRNFHGQHLRLAEKALAWQPVERRDFSGITMAIDPTRLPEARTIIRKFRREMMKFLEQGERTAVYHLAVQLYQLDDMQPGQDDLQ